MSDNKLINFCLLYSFYVAFKLPRYGLSDSCYLKLSFQISEKFSFIPDTEGCK